MLYPSDEAVDALLEHHREMVLLLSEVKESRALRRTAIMAKHHDPLFETADLRKGKILSIKCSCGFLVKYRKPLGSLEDFNCPRKEK